MVKSYPQKLTPSKDSFLKGGILQGYIAKITISENAFHKSDVGYIPFGKGTRVENAILIFAFGKAFVGKVDSFKGFICNNWMVHIGTGVLDNVRPNYTLKTYRVKQEWKGSRMLCEYVVSCSILFKIRKQQTTVVRAL